MTETLSASQAVLQDVPVTGDLSGEVDFTGYQRVTIETGLFAGKGFAKGELVATLSGLSFDGHWRAVAFFDPVGRKINLKGVVYGNIGAITEGFLTESVPGSGVFDQYHDLWRLTHVGTDPITATVELSGTLTGLTSTQYPSTALRVRQASMSGTAEGAYTGPLSATLTRVRIQDPGNPHNGEGFETVSYNSALGSGDGSAYEKVPPTGTVELRGLFLGPLTGAVVGFLDEGVSPRRLTGAIARIDAAAPPHSDLKVDVLAPQGVSPGQTITYVINYRNDGWAEGQDVVVVLRLPASVDYFSSSPGGIHKWETHEVFWRLEVVPPKSGGYLTVDAGVMWGLPQGEVLRSVAATGSISDGGIPNIQDYLDYEPVDVASVEELTSEEFNSDLEDPSFLDLYNYAQELGYVSTGVGAKVRLTDGVMLKLSLMTVASDTPEVLFLANAEFSADAQASLLFRATLTEISFFERSGGMSYPLDGAGQIELTAWGSWDEAHSVKYVQCVANCLASKLPSLILASKELGRLGKSLLDVRSAFECAMYFAGHTEYQLECSWALQEKTLEVLRGKRWAEKLGHINTALEMLLCTDECRRPNNYLCTHCNHLYWCAPGANGGWDIHCLYGGYASFTPFLCGPAEVCMTGQNEQGQCKSKEGLPNVDSHDQTVQRARDPNAKSVSPGDFIAPGAALDFTVDFENEGEGIAFGVYVTDTLEPDIDASTLVLPPEEGGTYDPATRTITWFIGELGSKEKGQRHFAANVRADATCGAAVINFATVYFPSVPETTPTNGVAVTVITPECDVDNDLVLGDADTCPTVPNPADADGDGQDGEDPVDGVDNDGDALIDEDYEVGQEDLDDDGLGDACDPDDDGDGLIDQAEPYVGTNPLKPDTDENGTLDGDEDSDDDGLADGVEATTYFTDPLKPDTDGDEFADGVEVFVGTDPLAACGPDAWPPDFNDDQRVNITDVFPLLPPYFGTSTGDPDYSQRRDLWPDGVINITDVFKVLAPTFGSVCTP